MSRKRKSTTGIFGIPIEVTCPYCGNDTKIELGRLQDGSPNFVCRPCRREVQLSEEQASRLLIQHVEKLEALRRFIKGR